MNKRTSVLPTLCACLLTWLILAPVGAFADSKTLPGLACDPSSNVWQYVKQFGAIRNAADVGVFYRCHIVRDKTDSSPVKQLQIKVRRPPNSSNFTCSFSSWAANGSFVQSKSRSTSRVGVNTLSVGNLKTVNKGTVSIVCALPSQGVIYSIFWNE